MEESESTEPDETESTKSTSKSKYKKKPSSQVKEGAEIEENESETCKVAQYRYTPTDINRLLHVPLSHDIPREADYKRFSLSGARDGDEDESLDIVHCLNKVRYVLPPIHGHVDGHEHKSPYEVLVE